MGTFNSTKEISEISIKKAENMDQSLNNLVLNLPENQIWPFLPRFPGYQRIVDHKFELIAESPYWVLSIKQKKLVRFPLKKQKIWIKVRRKFTQNIEFLTQSYFLRKPTF